MKVFGDVEVYYPHVNYGNLNVHTWDVCIKMDCV